MGLSRQVTWGAVWPASLCGAATTAAMVAAEYSGLEWPIITLIGLLGLSLGVAASAGVVWSSIRPTQARLDQLALDVPRLAELDFALGELGDVAGHKIAGSMNRVVRDLRDQVRDARANTQLLTSLVERSPNGVLICQSDGRIRTINGAFSQMIEVRGDPVGRLPTEVVSAPEVQELVDLARRGEAEDEIRVVPGPRTVVLRTIVTEGGEVGVLAQDVSAYKTAERSRTEFVANVSHELRTPMAAILGFAEIMSADAHRLPDDLTAHVDAIARNSRRLRDTFEGLMDLARVEARLGELNRETLRLQPLLAEAVAGAADEALSKGLAFSLECADDLWVHTNAAALDVIVRNLASNATRYTPTGGRVAVNVHVDNDKEVRVDFVDTGIGIEPAHQARVFERFFRTDEGRAREAGGTGLGLAMVRHLALATGATVTLASKVGEGSTFSLHLPRGKADP